MSLPKKEKTFDFRHIGELTGKVYEGQFTTKCILSIGDKRLLEIEKSRLTADLQNPTANLDAVGLVVANLRVRIVEAPDWFKQDILTLDTVDDEVFFEIYGKCLDLQSEWMAEVKKKAQPDKSTLTESESESEGNLQAES
jgi:hypothetical protein